ncbi:MAG: alkene reductase [Mariprofundaceae bacterium]|nr:alkene reductase [Mariprofundaceae bacterium]
MADLFSKIQLGDLTLPNRIIMAPMTRNRAPQNIPTPLMAEYYAQRASAGLIVTEGAQVSEQAIGYPATPGIHTSTQVEGWKQVTKAVHDTGGRIFIQLWHCGRISHPDYHGGELPVAPSAVKPAGQAFTYEGLKDFVTPRALETDEISGIVEQYRYAAASARKAGFDGAEIHAANGYLIDQFLRDGSNHRTDSYGGSLENRSRLLLEIVDAVTGEIGADRTGVRISPINGFNDMSDSDPQATFDHTATALSGLGLAFLHVVEVSMAGEPCESVDMQQLRTRFDGVYIANGGYDKQRANAAITKGRADLISFGVPFLANPDLPERFRRDAPLNEADQASFYGGDEHGYTDYSVLKVV